MKDETSGDLLTLITFREDEPQEARRAFDEFYLRYREHVWKACWLLSKGVCKKGDKDLAEQLLQDTFLKVYHKSGTFDSSKVKNENDAIQAWLFGIAKNTLKDYLKSETHKHAAIIAQSELIEDQHSLLDTDNEVIQSAPSIEMKALQTALGALTERERTITMCTFQFLEKGKLPDWLRTSLCEQYATTGANIRQIRSRALKKVLKFLKEQGYEVPTKIDIYGIIK